VIDFPNLKNIASVGRYGNGLQHVQEKKEATLSGASRTADADVVQISADAALKSKLSAFSSVLAKEMNTVGAEHLARLKQQYAGESCPVTGRDVAGAILARVRTDVAGITEVFGNE
jgi:hypothetical protein